MENLCTNELSWCGHFIPFFFFFCYCLYALRVFLVLIAILVGSALRECKVLYWVGSLNIIGLKQKIMSNIHPFI